MTGVLQGRFAPARAMQGTPRTQRRSRDATNVLHEVLLFPALPGGQGAAAVEFLAHQVEAEDAGLELLREALEERGFACVLEEIESGDDGVGVASGLDQPLEADGLGGDADGLRIHSGEEEGVIADLLSRGALRIKGRCG